MSEQTVLLGTTNLNKVYDQQSIFSKRQVETCPLTSQ